MINGLPATLEVAGLRQPVVTRFHDLWGMLGILRHTSRQARKIGFW